MTDFEAEGLLDDVHGEAREARLTLLRELDADGVPLGELREAVAAGRLALLPVERALAGDGQRYSAREVAEIVGIDVEQLRRFSAALGVPYADPDERRGTEADLGAARRMKAFLDAGLPEEGMLQVARTIGMGTARIAEANRELVIRTLTQPGDSERDIARRFAAAAEHMMPLIGPTVVHALQANMLEQIRRDVIGTADLAAGEIGGTAQLTVGFPAPTDAAPEYYAARLVSDIIGGGASSRLFQEVREERGLAYCVNSTLHPYKDTGLFYIYAATARSQAAAALALIEDIVAGAPTSLTQRELDRVRTQARAGLLMSLETPWGQAHYVARQLAVHGRLVDPAEVVERLLAVTLDEVCEAGARMVAGPRASATIGLPAVQAA